MQPKYVAFLHADYRMTDKLTKHDACHKFLLNLPRQHHNEDKTKQKTCKQHWGNQVFICLRTHTGAHALMQPASKNCVQCSGVDE